MSNLKASVEHLKDEIRTAMGIFTKETGERIGMIDVYKYEA